MANDGKTLVIGHRGAMGHVTENTLASIEKAMEIGVDMIEIDVFRIKSGEIVVFHDKTVERLSNGAGMIEDYNIFDLQQLRLENDQKIPMLQDVLQLIDHRARLNIELKGANTADRVNFIVNYYIKEKGWSLEDFLISSFNWDELRQMRELNRDIPIAILTDSDPLAALPIAKELNAEAINPHYQKLTADNVKKIRGENIMVYTWTVNDSSDISKMKALGVDGIITNFPERLR
jgi:glycerophosphoryl diester phosphodiesterase